MAGTVPVSPPAPRIVILATPDGAWRSPPVIAAASPARRWRGLRPWALGWGMLFAGCSVHGRGMIEELELIGLDRNGVVVSMRTLSVDGVARLDRAAFTLELPATHPSPPQGSTLTISVVRDRVHDVGQAYPR